MKIHKYYTYSYMSAVPGIYHQHILTCLRCRVFIINISEQIAIEYLSVIILRQVNCVYHKTSELLVYPV